jgi:long-chain acyl-CoA synthetase
VNLSVSLREAAGREPDKVALLHGATEVAGRTTYAEFDAHADRVASALVEAGIEHGDRVALAFGNTPEFCYSYYGVLRVGAIAVPLNAMLSSPEVVRILRDAEARVLMAGGPFGDIAENAAGDAPSIERAFRAERWSELPTGRVDDVAIDDDDLAVLAYTSGTTGEPKGAMLSYGNLRANLDQQMAVPGAQVEPSDVLLLALPLFHIFGLNVTLGLLVTSGATGVLLERFEPVPALQAIQDHRVSVIFGAPPMYSAWVNTPGADQYDLSRVRLAVSGAAPLPEDVLNSFNAIFGVDIFEGYGLTETSPVLTTNRMAEEPRALSVGKPVPGVELRIIDEAGRDVEVGDPGEIVVRGPNVFKGYWRREDATSEAFVDGWFRTGDVAVRDEDGYIFLVDRRRDLIIVSGFNVFPSEVEAALGEHPGVKEVAVIGAPHPYTGEAVRAFVVPENGTSPTQGELLGFLRDRIARFKLPESIDFVETLPHLPTGKILKRALPD